jgi:golgin subfamily A member 4
MVAVLRSFQPFYKEIDQNQKINQKSFVDFTKSFHKSYVETIDDYQKELASITQSNHLEIKQNKSKYQEHSNKFQIELKNEIEAIEKSLQVAQEKAQSDLEKITQNYYRELSSIEKFKELARKKYMEITLEIENEKKLSLNLSQELYDQKIKYSEEQLVAIEKEHVDKIEEIKSEQQLETDEHDTNYLLIKTNYSKLSINNNKKINEINKKHANAVEKLNIKHKEQMIPVSESITELKKEYQDTLESILNQFTEKFNDLNHTFDLQKEQYEQKKQKIVFEGNEAITVLNSKLSAHKESVHKEKLEISRKIRDEMKELTVSYDIDKKNRNLTYQMNQFDNELNKQINRTNRDILEKKRETQSKIYQLDLAHLKEINQWRSQKLILDLEKKQELSKLEFNFKHNLLSSELVFKKLEIKHKYNLDSIKNSLDLDLFTLDSQLMLAQSIQERDLNLLGNDAQLTIENYRHQEKMIELDYERKIEEIKLEKDKAKSEFEANTHVLNTTTQLELEKEKIKRDYNLLEQESRGELNEALLNRSKANIDHELKLKITEIELKRSRLFIEYKFKLDELKEKSLLLEEEKRFNIALFKYDTQEKITIEKIKRSNRVYLSELYMNQKHVESLMAILRMHYMNIRLFKTLSLELYQLPCHPETYKLYLESLKGYLLEDMNALIDEIKSYESQIKRFYLAKIEDQKGYHYTTNQEETLHYYQQKKSKIQGLINAYQVEIKGYEIEFFKHQSDLDKNLLFINQLSKISETIKNDSKDMDHKNSNIKENAKLIINHEKEIKRIKDAMKKNDVEIDLKNTIILKHTKEIEDLEKELSIFMKKIDDENSQKASHFVDFIHSNHKLYKKLTSLLEVNYGSFIEFIDAQNTQVYISDSFLAEALKKLEKSLMYYENMLNFHQQKLIKGMVDFYKKNEVEQLKTLSQFNQSVLHSRESLKKNHHESSKNHGNRLKKLETEKTLELENLKNQHKRKAKIDLLSFDKKYMILQSLINSIEKKISTQSEKQIMEINLLNQNQVSVAMQYKEEHDIRVKHFESDFEKLVASLLTIVQTSTKNQLNLYDSIETKNFALITRQNMEHDKIILTLKNKMNAIFELISKSKKLQEMREHEFEVTLNQSNKQREFEFQKLKQHMKKTTSHIQKNELNTFKQESKILRKSHFAKVKMLNLN